MGALGILMLLPAMAFAMGKDGAISAYESELAKVGIGDAGDKPENDVDAQISAMESDQYDVKSAYDAITDQVNAMAKNSTRRDSAFSALEGAKGTIENFLDMKAEDHLAVEPAIAGSLPYVTADEAFSKAHDASSSAISTVRRILITPDRPGAVPAGDITTDFLPQIIRQLFRFAWLAVLIAFTVSGFLFIMAYDNEERMTKAKSILYYTIMGFTAVALAFAIVKAVTDIDFFGFV